MNLALFLNRDLHANVALNRLLPTLSKHRVWVFLSDGVGQPPAVPELDQLRLLEQVLPNDFLFPLLDERARSACGPYLSFGRACSDHGFPCEAMNAPNASGSLERLRALDLDVIVSIRYGQIFQEDFLRIPRHGVLNLHSGLLPEYRGVLAALRGLLAGEEELGCTLHFIADASIDTGPVIGTARIRVDPRRSLFGHILALYEPGARLIVDAIEQLESGARPVAKPQQEKAGAYYSFPDQDELQALRARGFAIAHSSEYAALLARYMGP